MHKRIRDESRFALEFVRKEGLAKTGVAIPRLDAAFSEHLVKGSAECEALHSPSAMHRPRGDGRFPHVILRPTGNGGVAVSE